MTYEERRKAGIDRLKQIRSQCEALIQECEALIREFEELPRTLETTKPEVPAKRMKLPRTIEKEPTKPEVPAKRMKLSLVGKILLCLWQVGRPLTRQQVTFYTGLSSTSGPMCQAYADATDEGLIVGRSGAYELTAAGVVDVASLTGLTKPPEMPPGHQVWNAFCQREGGVVETMAQALYSLSRDFDHQNCSFSRATIAEHASQMKGKRVSATSGPACAAFARLQKLGVTETVQGKIALSDWVIAIVSGVSIKVRDTRTGEERRVKVK